MIEPMVHVLAAGEAARRADLEAWLYRAGLLHLLPLPEDGLPPGREEPDRSALEARVAGAAAVAAFCRDHTSAKPGFLDQLLPLKLAAKRSEIEAAAGAPLPDPAPLRAALEEALARAARLEQRRDALEPLAFLGAALPRLRRLTRLAFRLVVARGDAESGFLADERLAGPLWAKRLRTRGATVYYGLAAPAAAAGALDALIADHGLAVAPLPEFDGPADQELAALEAGLARARADADAARTEAARFADRWGRPVELALAHAESELARARRGAQLAAGRHVCLARGYLPAADLARVRTELEAEFPGAALAEAPAPDGESPPTRLRSNAFTRPAQLLVSMYGVPSYRGLDPTPFAASVFFAFVGICLGDTVYGLLLMGLMVLLKRRYREQKGLLPLFQLFLYCGAAAVVFGTLTGSFLGNLTEYLARVFPFLEPIDRFRADVLTRIDPIAQAQTALGIAIGIGVATQFYGIALCLVRNARRGDWLGAFADGFLWLAFFGGLIVFGLAALGLFPEALGGPALAATVLATVGLVLTQGRDQANWPLRLVVGVISVYGIVGSYGAAGFLGDVVSYARLMALALTGAALGSTANMLADMAAGLGVLGVVLAVVVVVGGHLANFALAILSAFVHSARLVLLEFFNRFNESDGYAFDPHGFAHPRVELADEET